MVPYDGQVHLQQDEDPLTPSLRIGEGGDSVPSPPILGSNEGEVGGDRWSEAVGGARPACYGEEGHTRLASLPPRFLLLGPTSSFPLSSQILHPLSSLLPSRSFFSNSLLLLLVIYLNPIL